jgi:hypothetical protein
MSGYLERLVNTAAGRGGAVHPRTGSIFSPHQEDVSSPLQSREDSAIVTLAQPRPQPHGRSIDVELHEPPQRTTHGVSYAPLLPAPAAPDLDAAARMPPRSSVTARPDVEPVVPRQPRHEPAPRRLTDATDDRITPPRHSADDASHPFAKAIRVSGADAGAAEPNRAAQERHVARIERPPDEIEIHIGRIEVIAVPPPAPRAPKPPDRSVSLDDYLSRRHGRSR